MAEKEKLGYTPKPIGENYLTIVERDNTKLLILIKLIAVEYDLKKEKIQYKFKTFTGKYLSRDYGDFYKLEDQELAESKWKEYCLKAIEKTTDPS